MPIIAVMLACLGRAFLIVARWPEPRTRTRFLLVEAALALFSGWLSAAVFVNATEVLPEYGFDLFGLSIERFSLLMVLASVLALLVMRASRGSATYTLAVASALLGVMVANITDRPSAELAWAAGAALALLTVALVIVRTGGTRGRPSPQP